MGVRVIGIQTQRAAIVFDGLSREVLLVVEIAQVELGQGITRIGRGRARVIFLGVRELPQAVINRAQVHQRARRLRIELDRLLVRIDGVFHRRMNLFRLETLLEPGVRIAMLASLALGRGKRLQRAQFRGLEIE